ASAKLAKSTVNHSHRAICTPRAVLTAGLGAKHSTLVTSAVSSTTSITGDRTSWRGSSLTKACLRAGRHSAPRPVCGWLLDDWALRCAVTGAFITVSPSERQVFGQRAQGQRR